MFPYAVERLIAFSYCSPRALKPRPMLSLVSNALSCLLVQCFSIRATCLVIRNPKQKRIAGGQEKKHSILPRWPS
ncbi:hypothetical protein M433DRAFT_476671 [Acidomyces richmondensis BFW]|nr:MAG: hypothetical protein FE78DRAFT_276294 [Acidomyces sp. 'richmondensis']KYG47734.1 hypothetical protein M433DRAFT_476671 [Acidomyces richmondensis BFW]